MLNISKTSVSKEINKKGYSTLVRVENKKSTKVLRRIIYTTLSLTVIILLLPWTQNVRSSGTVITLKPNQKPQSLHSIIAGRIEQWYVQEGDFVSKGDTLLKISEIKDSYFDVNLLTRTEDQIDLKEESIEVYDDKIVTQDNQLNVLKNQRDLLLTQAKIKLQQTQLKVQNDSIVYSVSTINTRTAQYQLNRMDSLYQMGLKSLTDLESRNLKLQETKSKEVEAKNNWLNSQNDLINLQLEIVNVQMKYETESNKLLSDKFSTLSTKLDAETNLSKLQNEYSNFEFRTGLYFITAPQDGYITRATASGIGETIKEGEEILTIMPKKYDLAVEVYVDPIDLPLMNINQKVRLQFDGWPAVVFAGWPNASRGTYGGEIYAIDQFISNNGKYRVLVIPDPNDYPWPDALRYGSGTSAMIMLNDVPIWYELWRNVNGFPADFYTIDATDKNNTEK